MRLKTIIILSAAIILASCSKTKEEYAPVPVVNVYSFMEDYESMDSTERTLTYKADSIAITAFMKTLTDVPDSREMIRAWADSRAVEVFTPAVDSVFGDGSASGMALGKILSNAKDAGLVLPERIYANVVYGRPESILFVDSVMLIALNHYLGENYPGYSHRPEYIRRTKTPDMLPYDIAEALVATEYPFAGGENPTLLSRILYEGALAHAKNILIEDDNPAMSLAYSDTEYKNLLDNERSLWKSLVENRLVYDTSETTAHKLIDPAPAVNIITPQAPGRVGRFLGYRIVESYLKRHPEATLSYILSPEFYTSPSVLSEAAY